MCVWNSNLIIAKISADSDDEMSIENSNLLSVFRQINLLVSAQNAVGIYTRTDFFKPRNIHIMPYKVGDTVEYLLVRRILVRFHTPQPLYIHGGNTQLTCFVMSR